MDKTENAIKTLERILDDSGIYGAPTLTPEAAEGILYALEVLKKKRKVCITYRIAKESPFGVLEQMESGSLSVPARKRMAEDMAKEIWPHLKIERSEDLSTEQIVYRTSLGVFIDGINI